MKLLHQTFNQIALILLFMSRAVPEDGDLPVVESPTGSYGALFVAPSDSPSPSVSPNRSPWYPPGRRDSINTRRQDGRCSADMPAIPTGSGGGGAAIKSAGGGGGRIGDGVGGHDGGSGGGAYTIHPRFYHIVEGVEGNERISYAGGSQQETSNMVRGGRGRRGAVKNAADGHVASEKRQRNASSSIRNGPGEYRVSFAEERTDRIADLSSPTRMTPRNGSYPKSHDGNKNLLSEDLEKARPRPLITTRDGSEDSDSSEDSGSPRRASTGQRRSRRMLGKSRAGDTKSSDDKSQESNPTPRFAGTFVSRKEYLRNECGQPQQRRQESVKTRRRAAGVGAMIARSIRKGPTVLSGHEGYIMSLALHEGILFSSAADGTAKVRHGRPPLCNGGH